MFAKDVMATNVVTVEPQTAVSAYGPILAKACRRCAS